MFNGIKARLLPDDDASVTATVGSTRRGVVVVVAAFVPVAFVPEAVLFLIERFSDSKDLIAAIMYKQTYFAKNKKRETRKQKARSQSGKT